MKRLSPRAILPLGAALLGLALVHCKPSEPPAPPPAPVQQQEQAPRAQRPSLAPAEQSDALKAARPQGGEYFGLYLVDKKVGYVFTDLGVIPGRENRVRSLNELSFKAQVGTRMSERVHREERLYENRPGGRLVAFTVEQRGDGGNQKLVGTVTPTGMSVVRKRPGLAVKEGRTSLEDVFIQFMAGSKDNME